MACQVEGPETHLHDFTREEPAPGARDRPVTRIHELVTVSGDGREQRRAYLASFNQSKETAILISGEKTELYVRRRYYLLRDGRLSRLASGALFCCSCFRVTALGERFYAFPKRARTVLAWCRQCRSELVFCFELRPFIEQELERHETLHDEKCIEAPGEDQTAA